MIGAILLRAPWDGGEEVSAEIKNEVWTSDTPEFLECLQWLHLDAGHHADRDLELAQRAAFLFAGTVLDRREGVMLHKMPR